MGQAGEGDDPEIHGITMVELEERPALAAWTVEWRVEITKRPSSSQWSEAGVRRNNGAAVLITEPQPIFPRKPCARALEGENDDP